jgi:hypothetical protein
MHFILKENQQLPSRAGPANNQIEKMATFVSFYAEAPFRRLSGAPPPPNPALG